MEIDEFAQGMFDSHEVVFVREHVIALRIDEGERIGAVEQLEGFHHVSEGDDVVLHSCQHADWHRAGDGCFGFVEQMVFARFFEEGLREDIPLFGSFIGIAPFTDFALLYFFLLDGGKIWEQQFFGKIGSRSDQHHSCNISCNISADILGVSFEDMECYPSSHRGSSDDPWCLRRDIFLCIVEDGDGVVDPVSDGCGFHGALRLPVRSVVEEDCCRVGFLSEVEDAGCFCSCCIGGIS